jgi:hypothetical protein
VVASASSGARHQEAHARAAVHRAAVRRGGRRGDDDRAPRRLQCQGQARARVPPGAPELAAGVRSGMTDRKRLLDELRPVARSPAGWWRASPRARTSCIKRCSGCIRHLTPGEKIAAPRPRRHLTTRLAINEPRSARRPLRTLRRRVAARADHHRPGSHGPKYFRPGGDLSEGLDQVLRLSAARRVARSLTTRP